MCTLEYATFVIIIVRPCLVVNDLRALMKVASLVVYEAGIVSQVE